jgi:hypothetical protein
MDANYESFTAQIFKILHIAIAFSPLLVVAAFAIALVVARDGRLSAPVAFCVGIGATVPILFVLANIDITRSLEMSVQRYTLHQPARPHEVSWRYAQVGIGAAVLGGAIGLWRRKRNERLLAP